MPIGSPSRRSGPDRGPSRSGSPCRWRRSSADEGGEVTRDMAEDILEDTFLRATEGDDFVGVQAYTRMHFGPAGRRPRRPVGRSRPRWAPRTGPTRSRHCVRRTAQFTGLPVLITESGIATEDDAERIAYLDAVLRGVHRCVADGDRRPGVFRLEPARQLRVEHGIRTQARAPRGGSDHVRADGEAERGLVRRPWPEPIGSLPTSTDGPSGHAVGLRWRWC